MVAATHAPTAGVFVYFGGSIFASTPTWVVTPATATQTVGYQASWAGDIDGDGFSDLMFLAPASGGLGATSQDAIRIYRGAATPSTEPWQEILSQAIYWVRGAGDVNSDGFQDVYVNLDYGEGSVGAEHLIFLGNDWSSPLGPQIRFGIYPNPPHVLGTIDLNNDGAWDVISDRAGELGSNVIWGSPGPKPFQPPKQAALFPGQPLILFAKNIVETERSAVEALEFSVDHSATPPSDRYGLLTVGVGSASNAGTCDSDLPLPAGGIVLVGGRAAVGDVDGDGYGDFVLGDASPSSNHAILYYGGCPVQRLQVLPGRDGDQGGGLGGNAHPATGAAIAGAGDLNGDGFPDFAVGNPFTMEDGPGTGEAYIYLGGPMLSAAPALILTNPLNTFGAQDGFGGFLD